MLDDEKKATSKRGDMRELKVNVENLMWAAQGLAGLLFWFMLHMSREERFEVLHDSRLMGLLVESIGEEIQEAITEDMMAEEAETDREGHKREQT